MSPTSRSPTSARSCASPGGDVHLFADRLTHTAGAEFTDRWERPKVARKRTGVKGLAHPEVGLLRLAFETLELPDPDRQRLVVYLPADTTTSAGLDRLAGGLRSVNTG
ncbi:MAG TPA: hypothetical protein VIY28_15790 [Pseudonocardiaceae bacterium]